MCPFTSLAAQVMKIGVVKMNIVTLLRRRTTKVIFAVMVIDATCEDGSGRNCDSGNNGFAGKNAKQI